MRRWIAVTWHTTFLVVAAALYLLFVIPRWFELTGAWPVVLGQVGRIVCGVLIGLSALPVVLFLRDVREPNRRTPTLSLNLLATATVLQVAAGVLVVVTALVEVWVSLDVAGPWLFAVYGAAAALAILAALSLHLSFVAAQPPPPPRPRKPAKIRAPKEGRRIRRRGHRAGEADDEDVSVGSDGETEGGSESDDPEASDVSAEDGDEASTTESSETEPAEPEPADTDTGTPSDTVPTGDEPTDSAAPAEPAEDAATASATDAEPAPTLRNRRIPGARRRRFGRSGVAVED